MFQIMLPTPSEETNLAILRANTIRFVRCFGERMKVRQIYTCCVMLDLGVSGLKYCGLSKGEVMKNVKYMLEAAFPSDENVH